uniref:Nucleotide-binding alpha-beta plait domain-containing protein n=1 Tax=Tanacetum cinerariifolium TaxID=118510 RepID=A0A699GIX9_TANCI|nr:nucleotide-binding alpha-beta plait domain-containing protein [Tanacetum cinerariifolium]
MEGGQEGEQGDSEGDDKREDVSSGNVVNYYFTNFPPEWNRVNLHELFAEIREIAHVYVARKVSKSGKRFGFAHFFQVGNLQALEKRLNRIIIGSFKLRANIAKYEKNTSKSNQGCKRKGWVFDIPCKLNALPTLDPSSSINETKVKYIGGSIFSLEFQNNEEGCNFTRVDYKKSVEQGVKFETGSNHVGDGFDSSRDNVEPLGKTLKCETPNEVVQDGSEEEPSYAAGNFSEKDGSVDVGEAYSNFELGYGSDSYVEKKGHLTDNGSSYGKGDGDLSQSEVGDVDLSPSYGGEKAWSHLTDNGSSYGKGDGDLSQSEVGDVDLSPSYGGEKVGLITPSLSTDVKERCISYYHRLGHVEIFDGLNSGSYAIPNQRVNTFDIISQKGKVQRNEKATHLKKRKMKTMNLFKLIQIKQRDKLMTDMKKGTPRLRSSKALKLLWQVAL